ncbi:MAG: adenosine-specific kinase [Pseudomonadota bacterium]
MELKTVTIEKDEEMNFILGQSHFIKTVEDLYEAMVNAVPGAKFGIAFCEASHRRLVRWAGTDGQLTQLAKKNALAIGAGHTFIIMMKDCFPINVLNAVKAVPEVCSIFCATANPTVVVVAEYEEGRGIMGVLDGEKPSGLETAKDIEERKALLRQFGYKM